MKKKLFLLLSSIVLFICCKSQNTESMNVTLEFSIPDIVMELSDNSTDSTFTKAMAMAHQNMNPDKNFITTFIEIWKQIAPEAKLNRVFSTYELRSEINKETSNSEILNMLNEKVNEAILNTIKVLESRIVRSGAKTKDITIREGVVQLSSSNVQKLKSGRIDMEITRVANPELISKLLQTIGDIGFWETFEIRELSTSIMEANAHVSSIENSDNSFLLEPNWENARGPIITYAKASDTAQISKWLNLPDVRTLFPQSFTPMWSTKPIKIEESEVFSLIAVKATSISGIAPLDGSAIIDAKIIHEQNRSGVLVSMDVAGAKTFAHMTLYNVGRSIAITIDDYVLTHPMVNSEITGGKCSITGSFSREEAEFLVNAIKTTKLPVPVKIVQ